MSDSVAATHEAPSKRRIPALAGLLNVLYAGLGFLYLGRPYLAFGTLLAFPLLLAVAGWSGLVFSPPGSLAGLAVLLAVWIASICLAVRIARRHQPALLAWYQRWYIYVGYVVLGSIVMGQVLEQRGFFFGYETYRFPSTSMAETMLPGDYFVSNPHKFTRQEPSRGDLIVFRYPGDPTIKYVKRVIGLPGETIVVREGEVMVNGTRLQEPYVSAGNNQGRTGAPTGEFKVPAGSYFVLGDNRDNSSDSRMWGSVPRANLYGNVEYIWLSTDSRSGMRNERIGLRPK